LTHSETFRKINEETNITSRKDIRSIEYTEALAELDLLHTIFQLLSNIAGLDPQSEASQLTILNQKALFDKLSASLSKLGEEIDFRALWIHTSLIPLALDALSVTLKQSLPNLKKKKKDQPLLDQILTDLLTPLKT
jgi:hypothetical protein